MTNKEYLDLPKSEPLEINIGSRFRSKESKDEEYSPGTLVSFYEIIATKLNSYEFMEKWERIEV